ncbi:MAG TPA: YlxR family protein [Anaerolineae bacterium]|nr:YlxR family protein [Anaerolineae bacterium]
MVKKKLQPKRQKHIPERTCIVCRQPRPKRELVRVVRTPEGDVLVDESGKKNGRGAYLCRQRCCWQQALKGNALNRALRINLEPEAIAALQAYAATLPEILASPAAITAEGPPETIGEI